MCFGAKLGKTFSAITTLHSSPTIAAVGGVGEMGNRRDRLHSHTNAENVMIATKPIARLIPKTVYVSSREPRPPSLVGAKLTRSIAGGIGGVTGGAGGAVGIAGGR